MARPLPEPRSIARDQLALAVRQDGFVIDLDSIVEVERQPVIVNPEQTDYRPAEDRETPTGHIVLWQCTGHERIGTDASDPVLDVTYDEEVGQHVAVVPEPHATLGGSVRIRHNLDAPVTVLAFQPDGEGIGYLFATMLDSNVTHVEFFGGTARFYVEKD